MVLILLNLVLIVGLVAGAHLWGRRRIAAMDVVLASAPKLKVAMLQANIDQYQKWDEAYEAGIRARYEELSAQASASKPDLIIWPESAVPGWFPNQPFYVEWVRTVTRASNTSHLIGAVSSRNKSEYNAAFFIDSAGNAVGEYDKQRLVPFGEYTPFGGFLKRWIPYLGQLGTFDRGHGPVLFSVAGANVAPNICYEAFFPELIHRAAAQGADVLVNVTNDGWFLDTGAPEQHYVANIFRAVETGRSVVRAANTGISAAIDATGRQIVRSPLLVSGVYAAQVPVHRFETLVSLLYSGHVTRTEK
jgi:apolipoprotein N-acyltransferase